MAKQGQTEIVLIVDRSGSMAGLERDTVGGINALLDRNRTGDGEVLVTLALFNHESTTLFSRRDIREVEPLKLEDYRPAGMTALFDAVGWTLELTRLDRRRMPEADRPEHTVVAIATDGYENASRRFTADEVKAMIEEHTEEGWEFLFLGANIDAAAEAARIGIAPDRAASFVCDERGSELAYEAFGDAIDAVRSGGPVPPCWAASCAADAAERAGR